MRIGAAFSVYGAKSPNQASTPDSFGNTTIDPFDQKPSEKFIIHSFQNQIKLNH